MMTFRNYVNTKWKQNALTRVYYRSFEEYLTHYADYNGFQGWLETIKCQEISTQFAISIAKTYIKYAKRNPEEIPAILTFIVHFYDVELPCVSGILTADYWVEKLGVDTAIVDVVQ